MLPILFAVGPISVSTHAAFIVAGVVAAVGVTLLVTRDDPLPSDVMHWLIGGGLMGGAIGARLAFIWGYVQAAADPTLVGFLLRGGRSMLGGLAGAYAGVMLTRRLLGVRRRTGDVFAPGVALGFSIGRFGCLLTEQPGTPTSLPWGLRLDPSVAARIPNCPQCLTGRPLHPSFAYEILFHALAFAVLWTTRRSASKFTGVLRDGDRFKLYLLAYAVFRFLVEFVRGNPSLWFGLSGSQLFLVPSTLLLLGFFALRLAGDSRDAAAPAPLSA